LLVTNGVVPCHHHGIEPSRGSLICRGADQQVLALRPDATSLKTSHSATGKRLHLSPGHRRRTVDRLVARLIWRLAWMVKKSIDLCFQGCGDVARAADRAVASTSSSWTSENETSQIRQRCVFVISNIFEVGSYSSHVIATCRSRSGDAVKWRREASTPRTSFARPTPAGATALMPSLIGPADRPLAAPAITIAGAGRQAVRCSEPQPNHPPPTGGSQPRRGSGNGSVQVPQRVSTGRAVLQAGQPDGLIREMKTVCRAGSRSHGSRGFGAGDSTGQSRDPVDKRLASVRHTQRMLGGSRLDPELMLFLVRTGFASPPGNPCSHQYGHG
jgi:hypothetical protein